MAIFAAPCLRSYTNRIIKTKALHNKARPVNNTTQGRKPTHLGQTRILSLHSCDTFFASKTREKWIFLHFRNLDISQLIFTMITQYDDEYTAGSVENAHVCSR